MAMNEKGLGKLLQTARQKAGLTQQQLCQQANLSFSTLAKIERGAIKAPSIFTIQAIAEALQLGLDELVGVSPPVPAERSRKKTKSGVSFVYFDVNGCLVHFFQRAFARIARDTGNAADQIESIFWHYNDDVCKGLLSLDEFNRLSADRLNTTNFDWKSFYLDAIEPVEEMQEVLRWAADNYRVGLLTNIMPGFLSAMRSNGSLPQLSYDAVIDSSQVGAIKPEEEIYRIATERAGVPPAEILLIDDSRMNLMAAEKAGWHVMWFDDAQAADGARHVREALEPAVEAL